MADQLSVTKDVAIIVGSGVALIGFFFGYLEYQRQIRQSRMTAFLDMRRRFLETPRFRDLLELLATDDPRLAQVSIQDRRNFLGFLEEIALMVESGMIRRNVAGYMFGYYALLCRRSEHFWPGLNPDSLYWQVFHRFADEMERFETENKKGPGPIRV